MATPSTFGIQIDYDKAIKGEHSHPHPKLQEITTRTIKKRIRENSVPTMNLCVVQLTLPNGKNVTGEGRSNGIESHSEPAALANALRMAIQKKYIIGKEPESTFTSLMQYKEILQASIVNLYTEREPCMDCRENLERIFDPSKSKIFFSISGEKTLTTTGSDGARIRKEYPVTPAIQTILDSARKTFLALQAPIAPKMSSSAVLSSPAPSGGLGVPPSSPSHAPPSGGSSVPLDLPSYTFPFGGSDVGGSGAPLGAPSHAPSSGETIVLDGVGRRLLPIQVGHARIFLLEKDLPIPQSYDLLKRDKRNISQEIVDLAWENGWRPKLPSGTLSFGGSSPAPLGGSSPAPFGGSEVSMGLPSGTHLSGGRTETLGPSAPFLPYASTHLTKESSVKPTAFQTDVSTKELEILLNIKITKELIMNGTLAHRLKDICEFLSLKKATPDPLLDTRSVPYGAGISPSTPDEMWQIKFKNESNLLSFIATLESMSLGRSSNKP